MIPSQTTIETATVSELDAQIRAIDPKILLETPVAVLGAALLALARRDAFLPFLVICSAGHYCHNVLEGGAGVDAQQTFSMALSQVADYRDALAVIYEKAGDLTPHDFFANRDFPGKEDTL
jgi:hypothetical protein